MVKTTKAVKVTAVLGINPGYFSDPNNDFTYFFMSKQVMNILCSKYNEIAERNFQEYKDKTGKEVYISAVITDNTVVYRQMWGCPEFGEDVITIECTQNPVFIEDSEVYKKMATKNITDLQKELKQSTVLIEYSDVEVAYTKKEL